MSARAGDSRQGVRGRLARADWPRGVALATVLVALGAPVQVMYHFIDVVGVPVHFLGVVAVALVAATALARVLGPRTAVAVGVASLAVGLAWYLDQLGSNPPWGALVGDALGLFAGRSLLRISNVRAWVLGVAPAPVFLTWYFAVRRWYSAAVAVAGATLGFFVLTGDADAVTTVTGVVASGAALGLGDLERRNEPVVRAESVLVVLALMILVPSLVTVVPAGVAGTTGPLASNQGGGGTVETSLLNADEDVRIRGSISLSPVVQFTVTSEERAYWRVGSYDRYTGDGWVRTGGTVPYDAGATLPAPTGPTRPVEQTVRVERAADAMPAVWKPYRASGVDDARVREDGSLAPADTLENGTTYTVESRVPEATAERLQEAGTDYPDAIAGRYTRLPESTPARVGERTARLTANAETPYETARIVERYLENEKDYSLDVDRPRGNVADAFLFEMDAGYCTYFATTMVAMLRSQDVPARFVVGYTPGQRVAEDRWVVRGLDSHAWVEVYFPDVGWVKFDPTPGGPRERAEQSAVSLGRVNGVASVDTNDSAGGEWTPTPADTPAPLTTVENETNESTANGTQTPPSRFVGEMASETGPPGTVPGDDDGFSLRLPTGEQLALGLVALAGTVAGIRRSRLGRRAYRAVWLRYQPRADPRTDVERAFQRLQYHLGRDRHRQRRAAETVRAYLDAVDAGPDARRVAAIRERARYGGSVSEADADEAVELVNRIVR